MVHTDRRLSRREMLRLSATALAGAALAACAPAPAAAPQPAAGEEQKEAPAPAAAAPVKIVATSQMGVTTWDGSLKRAKERLPHIQLEVGQTDMPGGWSGYADLVITRIAGGEQLDLVMIAVEGIPLLAANKVMRPLDPFFDADPVAKDMLMNDTHPLLRSMRPLSTRSSPSTYRADQKRWQRSIRALACAQTFMEKMGAAMATAPARSRWG